ncbi:extracellular solute-binding protein [Enterococcus sp.]|uniref:extracellular solute-binding protein n=1 Tax=Enterococcus sp. TaxID=35783 RepID=UPI00290DFAFE|nr:extracellular solute-binding protein [Enterococcus sp.]MDU5336646.1 extracellular solute-binding protein [Enterococcus sp.]
MKVSKLASLVIVAGACLGMLAGCGGGGSTSNSSAKDKKEIVFWNPFTGADSENIKKMINEYNDTNPDYKVKNVAMKEVDMYKKIPTVVSSGKNIPDLNIVHAERIQQYKDNEMLTTYDDVLADYPEIKADNYVEAAWNMGELDDKRYGLPLDIHSWGTYYNKALVKKYCPTALDDEIVTFDEIEEAGKKAKADNISAIGETWVKPNFLSVIKQKGGQLSENGVDPTLDTAASKDAIKVWRDLYEMGITNKDGEDATQIFVSGKSIFLPEGIWAQNTINEAEFEWGFTNSPQLTDDLSKAVNWSSSHQFVMFNNEDRSDAKTKGIMDFIEWLRTNSLEWAKAGQNPASLDILNNEEYKKMPQSLYMNDPKERDTLTIFDYKYNGYVSEYLETNGFDTIFGKKSVKDFTAGMQKEVKEKIAKDKTNK